MKFFFILFLISFILFVPAKIFLLVNHINSSPIKIKNINGTVWNASFNLVLTNDSSVINFWIVNIQVVFIKINFLK